MITVTRIDPTATSHRVRVRGHEVVVDMAPADGGADAGPEPHDLYDAALGACKALTVLWLAQRKGMPIEEIEVAVQRDASDERAGHYRLRTALSLSGPLSDLQRAALLAAAAKCPVHKLMTEVTTEIETVLID